MRIHVHVRDHIILVQCGEGPQRIRWLGYVGIARSENSTELGVPKAIRTTDNILLDLSAIINETLEDDQHVWVLLEDDTLPSDKS